MDRKVCNVFNIMFRFLQLTFERFQIFIHLKFIVLGNSLDTDFCQMSDIIIGYFSVESNAFVRSNCFF